jgi:hypothetical protein
MLSACCRAYAKPSTEAPEPGDGVEYGRGQADLGMLRPRRHAAGAAPAEDLFQCPRGVWAVVPVKEFAGVNELSGTLMNNHLRHWRRA